MAGRGTTFALQASVVRPVKAPQLGDPAPPAGAAQRPQGDGDEQPEALRGNPSGRQGQGVSRVVGCVRARVHRPAL